MCVSVCLSVPLRKPRFPVDWRLLVKESIANICIPLEIFGFLQFDFCLVLWSLQTSLLCMMGELAGVGYVAVAVGVSDR